jgi:2-polyprenyl-3-methyl-5-hydroxy-6-metoxy-1,4-benzoquinol methylase
VSGREARARQGEASISEARARQGEASIKVASSSSQLGENEMESKWYEQFFYGLAVDLWRKAITEERTREEADFIVETLKLQQAARILDVPCGLGRLSIELNRRGYQVTGVDLSEESIAEAKQNSEAAGLHIEWIQADMNALDKTFGLEEFDGAFCFGNSFGYADYNSTTDFLRSLSRFLKSGAKFVLDTGLTAESLLPNLPGRKWYKIDDMYMLSDASYDVESSQLRTQYTFIRDGGIQTGNAVYHLHTVAELKRLFAKCGLAVEALYSSTKRDVYRVGSPGLLVVSRKSL